jgi:putative endonuclease
MCLDKCLDSRFGIFRQFRPSLDQPGQFGVFLQGFVQAGGQDRIFIFCKFFVSIALLIWARRFESYSGSLEIVGGPFWVYVLENPTGRFYVGSTKDLSERIKRHNPSSAEYKGSKYTHKNGPWELVYYESCQTRSEAIARERFIKSRKSATWIRRNLLNG